MSHGVASDTSRDFVTAFYTSLGQYAHSTTHPLGGIHTVLVVLHIYIAVTMAFAWWCCIDVYVLMCEADAFVCSVYVKVLLL